MCRFLPTSLFALSLLLLAGCPGSHDSTPVDGAPPKTDKGNLVKLDTSSKDGKQPDLHLVPKKDMWPAQDQILTPDQPYNPTWRGPGGARQGWRLPR